MDESFTNRVHIVIVSDGYEPLIDKGYIKMYEEANIHDMKKLENNYWQKELNEGGDDLQDKFFKLGFINRLNMTKAYHEDKKEGKNIKKTDFRFTHMKEKIIEIAKSGGGRLRNIRAYGANNIAHCFSRAMNFNEWMESLPISQRGTVH
jgi:K+ transporter